MKSTAEKFWFIKNHIAFLNDEHLLVELEIEIQDVCPETNRIERYTPLNTRSQIWMELCPPTLTDNGDWVRSHDFECDCGGWTMDEAIDEMYQKVLKKYGDYTQEEYDAKWDEIFQTNGTSQWFSNQTNNSIWEDQYAMNRDVLDENEVAKFQYEISELKDTLHALKNHREKCPPEEYPAVDLEIEATEHNLFEYEISLKRGIDFT